MEEKGNSIMEYVASRFKERISELGLSPYRFINNNIDSTCRPTLARILRGKHSSNISTIAHFCDLLGLEIRIVKKQDTNEKTNEDNN